MNNITIEQLEQKYTELGAMIKSFEKQQEEAEFPKLNEPYYFINPDGSIQVETYESAYDEEAYSIGNCFRTQKEAEFAVERLKVIAEQKKGGWEISSVQFVNSKGIHKLYAFDVRGGVKQMTNYERIKNMTVEEMAELLSFHDEGCAYCIRRGKNCEDIGCETGARNWLESEVEE